MDGTSEKIDGDEHSRRQVILEHMADHILRVGLRGATLRQLAAAAGTSNRMLLYYFADKDDLIRATLDHLAQRLLKTLDSSRASAEPAPFHLLLPSLLEAMRSSALKPYMQLWLEIAAIASREEEPYLTTATQICNGFLAWVAACLQVEQETAERASLAALLLGTVDGLSLLNAIGCGSAVEEALNSLSVYPTKEKVAKEQ